MKTKIFLLTISTILLFSSPASGFVTDEDIFAMVDCSPDGNNNHLTATVIEPLHIGIGCVSPADPFDWYKSPGRGYVDWKGSLVILSTEPGLVYRLYLDRGSVLELVAESGLTFSPSIEMYASALSIDTECLNAGMSPPLNGDFYIRVAHYSQYSQDHPYIIRTILNAAPSDPGPAGNSNDGREVPLGESRYGTLTQTHFYNWFYWDHPSGTNADGWIELEVESVYYPDDDPGVDMKLYQNGHLLATGVLDSTTGFGFIDLGSVNITQGRYAIYLGLQSSTNSNGVSYRLGNSSTNGANQCGPDINADEANAVQLNPGVPVAATLCNPWDRQDFYEFAWNYWFIGDVMITDDDGRLSAIPVMTREWGSEIHSRTSFAGLSFESNPAYPATYGIRLEAVPGQSEPRNYTIGVYPNGTGPYRAPGHATWQDADDMLQYTEYGNFQHDYMFELDPQIQDRYMMSASTSTGQFLNGVVEIYGSTDDYHVVVGRIGNNGPQWGQTIYPDVRGRTLLDFGYQILTLPGDYVLKIVLDQGLANRRRFYVTQHLSILECWAEPSEGFGNAWSQLTKIDGRIGFNGVLCFPTDTADFAEFTIDPNLKVGIPKDYIMTVHAGYPGMRFWLYDSNQVQIWAGEVAELGGRLVVSLEPLVQEGETYTLKVDAFPSEERLMVWSADFKYPIRFMPMEAFLPTGTFQIELEEIL